MMVVFICFLISESYEEKMLLMHVAKTLLEIVQKQSKVRCSSDYINYATIIIKKQENCDE